MLLYRSVSSIPSQGNIDNVYKMEGVGGQKEHSMNKHLENIVSHTINILSQ